MTRRERAQAAARGTDERRRQEITAAIAAIEPGLDQTAIQQAIDAAARSRGARGQLLAELQADRAALTSNVSSSSRAAGRLALGLVAAGAERITEPRCPGCGQAAKLVKPGAAGRVCIDCYSRARTADCARCGHHRRIAGRDLAGGALCSSCRARDPANHRPCGRCARLAPVNTRTTAGAALCNTCSQAPHSRCDGCGELGPINSRKGGQAHCQRCYRQPPRRCGGCGRVRRIALTATGDRPDLCPTCHWAPIAACIGCGEVTQCVGVRSQAPRCFRCIAATRLDELLGDTTPMIALRDAFLAAEQPRSIHSWLDRSPARHIARRLATGQLDLTHAALDGLEQTPSLTHLRALLVAVGTLPERDPQLARVELAVGRALAEVDDLEHRRLLRAFATWWILHRVRRRAAHAPTSVSAPDRARTQIVQAHQFLRNLTAGQIALRDATQRDVDRWLSDGPPVRRYVSAFLDWTTSQHQAHAIAVPSIPTGGIAAVADPQARWTLARRLLHDDDLDAADRVAGALVVLYAQPVARITRLRSTDVTISDGFVYLRLAHDRVLMPDTLGDLVRQLPHRRQTGPSGAVDAADQWLFPGRHAAQPQHPEHVRRRLGAIGIECRAQRTTALLQLAAEVPAAVLADTLGFTPRTAVRWAAHAAGNWTTYAARRADRQHTATRPAH